LGFRGVTMAHPKTTFAEKHPKLGKNSTFCCFFGGALLFLG